MYHEEAIKKALEYGAVDILIISKNADKTLSRELKKKAKEIASTVEVVSKETEEGEQFLNLSGVGAILRFEI